MRYYAIEKPINSLNNLKAFCTIEEMQRWIDKKPEIRRELKIKKHTGEKHEQRNNTEES